MKNLKLWAIGLLAVVLGACGGGDDSLTDSPDIDDPASAAAESIALLANPASLQSANDFPVEITAIVTDALSGAVEGAQVRFVAGPNAFLSSSTAITDEFGFAKVNLSSPLDPSNRDINVSAQLLNLEVDTIVVPVTGTTIEVTGPDTLGLGDTATYTAFLQNSGGAALANRTVTLSSDNGNTISAASILTGSDGRLSFDVTADVATDDTVRATALGATGLKTVSVSNDSFAIIAPAPGTEVALGTPVIVNARWIQSGVPQVGQTINFASARGTLSSDTAVTNGLGEASVTLTSTSAGVSELTVFDPVSGAGNSIDIEFVATVPATLELTAQFENLVPGQTTDLEARIEDASGNAVKNQQVRFSLISDDTNGDLSPLIATTDSNGIARSFYQAGPNSSGSDSVVVRAEVTTNSAINDTSALTVAGQAFSFDIGTGNSILELSTTLYGKEYSIVVTDANSNPVPAGESVQVAAPPTQYRKGTYEPGSNRWVQVVTATCAAEDVNRNGQRDNIGLPNDEDINGNGILDPSNVVSVAPIDASLPLDAGCEAATGSTGSSTTVETNGLGIARVCLIYNQDNAGWAEIELRATAGVTGSESAAFELVWLTGISSDFDDLNVEPPGRESPYGVVGDCADPL